MSLEPESLPAKPVHHRPPTPGTEKALYGIALTCGIPSCSEPLYRWDPAANKHFLNSRVAHIHARSEGGPRWDAAMSEADNRSYENLIPMCERHASQIDITPDLYPPDQLREWKQRQAEERERAVAWLSETGDASGQSQLTFSFDEFIEQLLAVVPPSTRSRSRAEALELAGRESLSRSIVRLRSTPADRKDAVLAWNAGRTDPVVNVPKGSLRVLVAPMGTGKSEEAERWWSEGLTRAWTNDDMAIPLWLQAREIGPSLFTKVRELLGGDPEGPCRIVLDELDVLDPRQADHLLDDARRLVLTWPQLSVLATTRPGAGTAPDSERLDIEAWSVKRGLDLLRVVVNSQFIGAGELEIRQLLTSPLQIHALGSRLCAGGDAKVSTSELLAGLADSIIEREHPDASAHVWANLTDLAVQLLDSRGPVRAASFGQRHLLWEMEKTGLVVRENGRLRFALALFEQHFAAQALKSGDVGFDAVAGPGRFPRWRYAIAFAMETSTAKAADAHMIALARANPAAASWVLEQLTEGEIEGSPCHTELLADGPERSRCVAGQLRSAVEGWLAGLGDLGPYLELHYGERMAPWAVGVAGDRVSLGQPYEGTFQEEIVVLDDLNLWSHDRPRFRVRSGFPLPQGRLARWYWARERLRKPLTELMERRILPVPHSSPLAIERAWHLGGIVMTMAGHRSSPAEIPLDALRPVVDGLAQQAARAVHSRWGNPGGWGFDSGDVYWLRDYLEYLQADTVRNPRPLRDQSETRGFVWRAYSPELTRSITAAALHDALIGYRELVEANFPGYADSFELYRAMPIRAEGSIVVPHPEDVDAWFATVEYCLYAAASGDRGAPDVQISIIQEPHQFHIPWPAEDDTEPDHRPLRSLTQVLSTHLARQATNLAYSWLTDDLTALGWLARSPVYID
ncbi:hypothetical protein ACFVGM_02630 [Kitasatospora purpeofusca]|uniref:hypothetical protein n=1 Tax=Kitasatospora purpeofusca TaxID=67352 RepID=UPI0036762370